jgi:pyrroline-5-carboxylate reductase
VHVRDCRPGLTGSPSVDSAAKPVLLVGAGHMGGALIAGWRAVDAIAPSDLSIHDPHPGAAARAAQAWGAWLNGGDSELSRARTIVLAVKPQVWREVAADIEPKLTPGAVLVSIVAGVGEASLAAAFPRQRIARAIPTTAAALNVGSASLWSSDPVARARARTLFEPLGAVVDLDDEALMHVATAASGSAPAYVYALAEALEAAARARGLEAGAARQLSRSAIVGAAALLEAKDEDAAELRRQVASPGGTTEAALNVLLDADNGIMPLIDRAVGAAADRSRALASS